MAGVVAIVGRANVGKSTIFNRMVGERISIVEDVAGVTRDRIYAKASWLTKEFSVIDTGGIELENASFTTQIKQKLQLKKQMLLYLLLMVEKVLLKKMSM